VSIAFGRPVRIGFSFDQDTETNAIIMHHEGGRIRAPKDGMRRLSKDRATAGLQRRQKAGEFLF
jgi:hypothetical protein